MIRILLITKFAFRELLFYFLFFLGGGASFLFFIFNFFWGGEALVPLQGLRL